MANRKYSQRNVRKITRTGSSLSVSVPVAMLKKLGWREKQKVVVKKIHGGVQIKDWKK
jgi:antitoxin component of MazEF toxin-antitoxin module